jgi:hypothetical protein
MDAVAQTCRHVDTSSGLGIKSIISQRDLRLALKEAQDSGHGSGVFGKFLALGEAEDFHLNALILVQRPAQDAVGGRLRLLRQIGDVRVG